LIKEKAGHSGQGEIGTKSILEGRGACVCVYGGEDEKGNFVTRSGWNLISKLNAITCITLSIVYQLGGRRAG